MHNLVSKYLINTVKKAKKAPKVNIVPVKIDFPLPERVVGSEKRLNTSTTFKIPEATVQKNRPEFLIGSNTRIIHINDNE
jgi:hypothetical protein